VVTVKGRHGRKLARELATLARAQRAEAGAAALAQRQAFRFRHHLVPFWWLAWVLGAGLGAWRLHALPLAASAAVISGTALVLLTRHLGAFTRRACQAMGALTVVLLPLLALDGTRPPTLPLVLACWTCVTVPWVHHYQWRPQAPHQPPDTTDADIWARLAAKRKWSGYLGEPTRPAPGTVQYPILLNGAETNIGEVMAHPRAIAAAWNKPMTEAYAEPDPAGVESRGVLTLLKGGTLEKPREWDGRGADPGTGRAVIARFADSADASVQFWVPRNGTKSGLLAGDTGSGKTYALDLIVRVAVASGLIVPIILDPQEGQSLPQWRGHVRYASGVDECRRMLKGIRDGMLGRSRKLASLTWTDEDGHQVQGMDFFDPFLTGLPIVLTIADEFPLVISPRDRSDAKEADQALSYAEDIAKLQRKTGAPLWLVTQVPSLEELRSRVLRSMLVGSNVVCLRTGERGDAGMIGMEVDPSKLPKYFAGREPTAGLGYVLGPELRQAPARIDMVPRHLRRQIPQIPQLDPAFAAAVD
jgi:hypothetical protein